MIADEYKKKMAMGCEIDRIRKNKRAGIPIIKERGTSAPRNACNPLQIPD